MKIVPVYRLQGHGDHFYTVDAAERDSAISQYGYEYEGIAFYAIAPPEGPPEYAPDAMTSILENVVRTRGELLAHMAGHASSREEMRAAREAYEMSLSVFALSMKLP